MKLEDLCIMMAQLNDIREDIDEFANDGGRQTAEDTFNITYYEADEIMKTLDAVIAQLGGVKVL
jgi:hypothetical protein